ncbi:hypothetical protein ELQ35_04445 [Peribacillus cavernae]|uniref:Uncharacterized protein n=1 Tax=Peribacillus cavernae TaxID=1674310 RepID=A0A433HTD4_9BACI|nr:hypothetical protein [Peribacillus cavernae]MDQ0218617.1 hypothetical protein [Peribacillus cavernae]RUQ31601.1 hypothetical protein ELQ35_04445 [Peribacillus cavernae]
MKKTTPAGIQRGQAITFRLPSDTPDHILRQIQQLKETEKRNFSSKIAEFVIEGAGNSSFQDREMITIPLPQKLSKTQRDWLKHAHSEALLGSIIYQLLSDPLRATALLASLNSNEIEIDKALYLQEDTEDLNERTNREAVALNEKASYLLENDNDLDEFDWNDTVIEDSKEKSEQETSGEESLDDLLGDFLAQMNK